jgi:FMN phosphatase YigB (HAD superfamily)
VLFDAGGVLVLPDPVAIGDAMEPFVGSLPHHRFHRAHHAGMRGLEAPIVDHTGVSLEELDWLDYLRAYVRVLGVGDGSLDPAVARFRRVFSSYVWRYRIEESVAALNQLAGLGIPMGVVSNATGQIEAVLKYVGVCQVGPGAGVPVACVVDSAVVGVAKPDPAIFAPALAALGDPDPARVAYVGDSAINDVGGAVAAGLVPIQLDPFDDYTGVEHERIRSVWDLIGQL